LSVAAVAVAVADGGPVDFADRGKLGRTGMAVGPSAMIGFGAVAGAGATVLAVGVVVVGAASMSTPYSSRVAMYIRGPAVSSSLGPVFTRRKWR